MRKATQGVNLVSKVRRGKDVLYCASLGADFVSEHEGGVRRIWEHFGIKGPREGFCGLEARRIQRINKDLLVLRTVGKYKVLTYDAPWGREALTKGKLLRSDLRPYSYENVTAAWTSFRCRFGILTDAKEDYLDQLQKAFLKGNVAVGIGLWGGNLGFQGLCFVIIDRAPKNFTQEIEENDRNKLRLKAAADATGIKERLQKAGKKFFALSPRWEYENCKPTGNVVFWLNPQNQSDYEAGWYSVKELDQWIEGHGPIVAKKRSK